MTGLLINYLGRGDFTDRPATPDVAVGALALYYADDVSPPQMYAWNGDIVDWDSIVTLDAASDGDMYVRLNGDWVVLPAYPDVPDVPATDGIRYGMKDGAWDAIPDPDVEEAPVDGTAYVRKDAGWVAESGGGGGGMTQVSARYWALDNIRHNPNLTDAASMAAIVFYASGSPISTPTILTANSIDASNAIANAFDGNASTFWSTYGMPATLVVLDFGTDITPDELQITCRNDNNAQVPFRLDLFAGDDPKTMELITTIFCGDVWPSNGYTASFTIPEVRG